MAGQWRLSPGRNGASYFVRTITRAELEASKLGQTPDVGTLPAKEEIFAFDRRFIPARRVFKHHEQVWPTTSPGRNRLGFPTKRKFPTRRLRLIASK